MFSGTYGRIRLRSIDISELLVTLILTQQSSLNFFASPGYHPDHFWQHQAEKYKRYGPPTQPTLHSPPLPKMPSFAEEEENNGGKNTFTEPTAAEEKENNNKDSSNNNNKSSTDDKIQILMAKIEQQAQELERLRVLVTPTQTGTYED